MKIKIDNSNAAHRTAEKDVYNLGWNNSIKLCPALNRM